MSQQPITSGGRSRAMQHRKSQVAGASASPAASAPATATRGRRPARPAAPAPKPAQAATNPRARGPKPEPILNTRAMAAQSAAPAPVQEVQPVAETQPSRRPARRASNGVKNTATVSMHAGRQQSKAYRKASAAGRTGQSAFLTNTGKSGAMAKMSNPEATTRDIAKQVRAARCSRGGAGCKEGSARPSAKRKERERAMTPEKVGYSNTLSGQDVSGTMVGQGPGTMTGGERGACSIVSGTEYLGTEEFNANCGSTPNAAPAKVTQTSTTRGQTISGVRMGQDEKMTGNEVGQCKAITGTEYIPADQSQAFCGAVPTKEISKPERKTSVAVTGYNEDLWTSKRGNRPVSGGQPGIEGLTGAQKGACEVVTGTPYLGAEQVSAFCQTASAAAPGDSDFPQMMNAVPATQRVDMSQPLPSPEVEQGSRITGDGWDRGSKVTGTDGPWANSRNTSVQSQRSPMTPMGAQAFRPNAMAEVPQSPITGSSGNTDIGAKVTLSGGARA